jgi:hypothetical protein
MTSITWTAAPAGILGLGGTNARPYAVQGTAVPFGGSTVEDMSSATRLRITDRQAVLQPQRVVEGPAFDRLVVEVHVQKPIAPTNGTTLGIPSSSRPPS